MKKEKAIKLSLELYRFYRMVHEDGDETIDIRPEGK